MTERSTEGFGLQWEDRMGSRSLDRHSRPMTPLWRARLMVFCRAAGWSAV
jgi:hypothetical protein